MKLGFMKQMFQETWLQRTTSISVNRTLRTGGQRRQSPTPTPTPPTLHYGSTRTY
jgi:hypothetical protein